MFVQVIEGKVKDRDAFMKSWRRWGTDLKPGANGFLGSTGGVTSDGRFIACARFESEAAARANSDRPEQGVWWAEMEKSLDGPASFDESTDVSMVGAGGSDKSGFVQMMRARLVDRAKLERIEGEANPEFEKQRPDLMGAYRVFLPGDQVVMVDYFTSEADARAGEAKEMPPSLAKMFAEWQSCVTDTRWFDLTEPLFDSA